MLQLQAVPLGLVAKGNADLETLQLRAARECDVLTHPRAVPLVRLVDGLHVHLVLALATLSLLHELKAIHRQHTVVFLRVEDQIQRLVAGHPFCILVSVVDLLGVCHHLHDLWGEGCTA